jgi:hypothetical protein
MSESLKNGDYIRLDVTSQDGLDTAGNAFSPLPSFSFSIRRFSQFLTCIIVLLMLLNTVAIYLKYMYGTGNKAIYFLDQYFNMNYESNFPAFFSSIVLLFAALLLYVIYKLSDVASTYKRSWLMLACIFLFLSADEAIEIHERINGILRLFTQGNASGYLLWIWVVPYVMLAAAVGFYNIRLLRWLPKATRNRFLIAGCLYVVSAAGIESLEGHLMKTMPTEHIVLMVTTTVQETLEMASISYFIYALLTYMAATFPAFSVQAHPGLAKEKKKV